MSQSPIVSVCLPVFNGGRHLAQAIQSLLNQSFSDFELLIADDNSSDDSLATIESFAKNDRRIRFWGNTHNVGLFENYNACMKESRGKYIKPLAQDDILDKQNLTASVNVLDAHASVMLVANKRAWIDEDGNDISAYVGAPSSELYLPSNKVIVGREVIRQSLSEVVNFIGEPSTVMFRKNSTLPSFDANYHHLGDLDLWLQILKDGDYFFIDTVLSYFRIHEASRSSENIKQLLFAPDLVRIAQKFEDVLSAYGNSYEKLMRKSTRALCDHVKFLALTQQILPNDFRSDRAKERYLSTFCKQELNDTAVQEQIMSDLLSYRELLFYASKEGVMSGSGDGSLSALDAAKQKEITKLENQLTRLLSSPSWKMTRVLRDVNAYSPTQAKQQWEQHQSAAAGMDDPEAYIQYLRNVINRVKQSRSWKLTRHLRNIGIL